MTLPTALAASCDTWFYQLGYDFYKAPPSEGHPLQAWAAKFGFGRKTGVDVGPESAGLLPTPEWRKRTFTAKTDPGNWQIDSLWKPGDSIQLAIGQKDLLVTPLQMARFYAADRQRRQARAAAPGDAGRGGRRHAALAAARRAHLPGAGAAVGRARPDLPRRRAGRALAGDALAGRDLDERLRQLPDPDRRQDRHRAEGPEHRPEATSRGGAATGRRRAPRRPSSSSAR